LAIPVGLIMGLAGSGLRVAFEAIYRWTQSFQNFTHNGFHVLQLGLIGLFFGLALKWLRWERFRSPAHVILAARDRDGRFSIRDGLITAAADIISLGFGASVGRHGPAVQLGATIGSGIGQFFRLDRDALRILLGCGVAGAVSASFNAPIAGVIFAHEMVIGHFRLRGFAPVTLASVAAILVVRNLEFEYTTLKLELLEHEIGLLDYAIYGGVGLAAAILAISFMWSVSNFSKLLGAVRLPIWTYTCVGGLLAGLVGFWAPGALGLGDSLVQEVLSQPVSAPTFTIVALVSLLIGKFIATTCCLGTRFPGGIFSPSMFMGAILGAVIGLAIPGLDYQIASLVGMGAMVGAVVGAPLATILIVFELTEDYQAATAVMVGVVASNVVVTRFYARSFFHRMIRGWGINLDHPKVRRRLEQIPVTQLIDWDFLSVSHDTTVAQLVPHIRPNHRGDIYVIDDERGLIGRFPIAQCLQHEGGTMIGDIMEPIRDKAWLDESDSVWDGFCLARNSPGISVPVVADRESRYIVGRVLTSRLLSAYFDRVEKETDELL
ncbi:MAG: chloride channel protein, partial [Verrucomicrobiota bacterium]